ncbi:sensor histidine kinase [Pseudomonas chlororaphis subsp. aureofaciens 30-84]|nr:sensor histidine kinase [Pseudomonas chlororaphis subsp. aureofaciens 30-84]
MNRLRALWPRKMVHQLSVLLLLALLASNAIAMLVLQRTGALIHPLSRTMSLERLVTAHHAALEAQNQVGAQLLASMITPDARFWIDRGADVEPFDMRAEEQRLANVLRERLQLAPDLAVVMQLERVTGGHAREQVFSPAGWAPLRLRSSIELPDGRYLNTLQHPVGAYEWRKVLTYSLPVTIIPVLLIVMFCISRVVQPVKTLVQASERVSRGEWIAPLPLTGPQEARDLTAAFNHMQASIARHVEGRTRMLAAISHDLNTPITELRLQVELLEEGDAREDMLESLEELSLMVRETLNFVREDAVQEPTLTISLNGLLDDLAKRYQLLNQPVTWHGAPRRRHRPPGHPRPRCRASRCLVEQSVRAVRAVRRWNGRWAKGRCRPGPGHRPRLRAGTRWRTVAGKPPARRIVRRGQAAGRPAQKFSVAPIHNVRP